MPQNFESLIRDIAEGRRNQFEIDLLIDEFGRDAALDVTIYAMDRILFCGWMARMILSYMDFLNGSFEERDIPYKAVQLFDTDIVPYVRQKHWSWIDSYENRNDLYDRLRHIQEETNPNVGFANMADLLRLEIVSLTKVNPAKFKIRATGEKLSAVILAIAFAACMVIRTMGAEECRKSQREFTQKQIEWVVELAKRQGRMTPDLKEFGDKIIDGYGAGIAACDASLDLFTLSTNEEGIKAEVNGRDLREKKR